LLDVVALGEILIDFTPAGKNNLGKMLYEMNPGGAPANVVVAVSKLGGKCAFIGKVGDDSFGIHLKYVLDNEKVCTEGLIFTKDVSTTLSVVSLDENGDRKFNFYRNPGADIKLEQGEVNYELISDAKIFHFGSLSLTDEPSRSATKNALMFAKNAGKIISYDPNYRPILWKSQKSALDFMEFGLEYADIVKVSESELEILTGEAVIKDGIQKLINMGIKIVVVTMGSKGCYFACQSSVGYSGTYDTKVIDTTGAGDSFMGCLLYHIIKLNLRPENITIEQLENIADFSNAAGAMCAAKRGAIPAMPNIDDIKLCMSKIPKLVDREFN